MTIYTRVGDRSPWTWSLLDGGAAVDLSTGVSDVVIHVRKRAATTNKIDGASVTFTSGGGITYTPSEADVDTSGTFDILTVVQYSDGRHEKYPDTGYDTLVIGVALDE